MSVFSADIRAAVVARAGDRCEYCHLPSAGQIARFPIDHIIPRGIGGRTELGNLCLACPHCNAIKWAHTEGLDPATGRTAPLFNPRTQSWAEHFRWSPLHDSPIMEGVTPVGRATVNRLQLNHADMVAIRRLLFQLGLFPEGSS